jgi:hypothetical protein
MKLCLKILAIAVIAVSTYSLIGCAAPASFSYQNVTVLISAQCADCENFLEVPTYNPAYPLPPAVGSVPYITPGGGPGGNELFTATVTNAPSTNVTWAIFPTPNLGSINNPPTGTSFPVGESGSSVGTITAASGNTALYSAPSGPPIYTGAALLQAQALGIPMGDVLLVASVPVDPSNPATVVTGNQLVQVVNNTSAPTPYLFPHTNTTPANINSPAVTVARNTSFQFLGGVVGALPCTSSTTCATQFTPVVNSANNFPVWMVCPASSTSPAAFVFANCLPVVNGISGNATVGTVTQTGLYTAPATIPPALGGPIVLVTAQEAPTITNTQNFAFVGVN